MRKCTYLKRNAFRDSVLCDLNAIAFHDCKDNQPGTETHMRFSHYGSKKPSLWVEVRGKGKGSTPRSDDTLVSSTN